MRPFAITVALTLVPALAAASPDPAPHARASFVDGQLFVRGPFDADELPLTVNAVLREGDVIRSDDKTFAEVELPSETFLRLSSHAIVRIDRLSPALEVSVVEGEVYVSTGRSAGDALVSSSFGTVGPSADAIVRLEASRVGKSLAARIARGTAEVTCVEHITNVGTGEMLACDNGKASAGHWRADPGDAFDRWNRQREERVRHYSAAPPEIAGRYEGLYDLEGQGDWVFVSGGWYWRPTVVAQSWRPYLDGYWAWQEPWGWTWVPYASWGFVTHHYGRWVHLPAHGWAWSPAPVFAGAWVVWASFDGYLGWAPADFWGRPVVLYSGYSYYDPHVWCFGPARYFHGGGGNYRFLHGRGRDLVNIHQRGGSGEGSPFFIAPRDPTISLRGAPIHDPLRNLAPSAEFASRHSGRNQLQAVAEGPALQRIFEVERLHDAARMPSNPTSAGGLSRYTPPSGFDGDRIGGRAGNASDLRANGPRSFDPALNADIQARSGRAEEKPLFVRPRTNLTRRFTDPVPDEARLSAGGYQARTIQREIVEPVPAEAATAQQAPAVGNLAPHDAAVRADPSAQRFRQVPSERFQPVQSGFGQPRPVQSYQSYPQVGQAPQFQPRFGQPQNQGYAPYPGAQAQGPRFNAQQLQRAAPMQMGSSSSFAPAPAPAFRQAAPAPTFRSAGGGPIAAPMMKAAAPMMKSAAPAVGSGKK